jgi:hypothetical protein
LQGLYFAGATPTKQNFMPKLFLLLAFLLARSVVAQPTSGAAPHTIGTAEQELAPEKLDLLLTYHFSDNVKDNERTQSQEENLRKVVSQASISPDKLVLDDLTASGYGGLSKTANTNVSLTKVYRLTLDNPQQLNALVPQLVQTGADNLRVVNLRSSKLAATKAEVTAQAVADARQKAGIATKAAGGQVGGVVTMVEVLPEVGPSFDKLREYQVRGYSMNQAYQTATRPADIENPNLRKIKVLAVYDVVFEIKP